MKQSSIKGAIQRASAFGLVYLILIIPADISGLFLLIHSFIIPIAIVGTILNCSFIILQFGVLAIAQEKDKQSLSKYIKINIVLTTLLIVFGGIGYLLLFYKGVSTALLMEPISFLINLSIGVLNIRLAKSFLTLEEEYGKYAVNAAKWNRIGGWFVVFPVVDIVGYLIMIIGEYSEWRIVKQRLASY